MKYFLDKLKAKIYCWKIKKKCERCKYYYDDGDWFGCPYNF